jgi:hypothetical protein
MSDKFIYVRRTDYQWNRRHYMTNETTLTNSFELASWLESVNFQLVVCVRPSKEVGIDYLNASLMAFQSEASDHFKSVVAYCVGIEDNPADYHYKHFHCCLTSDKKLDRHWINDYFEIIFGRHNQTVDIHAFDRALGGIAYCLKIVDCEKDLVRWNISDNLRTFLVYTPHNSQERRLQRRHQLRELTK